jgi:pyrroline-5-carboxylate reductase
MIPNAPSLIHKGYNPVVYSDLISTDEKTSLRELFGTWGEAPEVAEAKLEAYAILTAMGPTYFWFQWLKLQELGATSSLIPYSRFQIADIFYFCFFQPLCCPEQLPRIK